MHFRTRFWILLVPTLIRLLLAGVSVVSQRYVKTFHIGEDGPKITLMRLEALKARVLVL